MKSKKTSSNKLHSLRETATDVSIFVDPPLTKIPLNLVNRGALQALPLTSQFLSSSQLPAVLQSVGVNVSAARQLAETNVFVP